MPCQHAEATDSRLPDENKTNMPLLLRAAESLGFADYTLKSMYKIAHYSNVIATQ